MGFLDDLGLGDIVASVQDMTEQITGLKDDLLSSVTDPLTNLKDEVVSSVTDPLTDLQDTVQGASDEITTIAGGISTDILNK